MWQQPEFCNAVLNASYLLATTPQEITLALQYIERYVDTNNDNLYKVISMAGVIFDKTRQSGDDVGHTLRTIFHMVQIQKVKDRLESFNIKTDDAYNKSCFVDGVVAICDSIGQQWKYLDNTQKLIVAKTLGGTRCAVATLNLFEEYPKVTKVCEKLSEEWMETWTALFWL